VAEPLPAVYVLVDRRPTGIRIAEKGEPAYFADAVLAVEQKSGVVLVADIVHPEEPPEAVLSVLETTVAALQGEGLEGGVIWVARQESVSAVLAAAFGEEGWRHGSPEAFAWWDVAYLSLCADVAGVGATLPYLWHGDVTPEEVGEMFAAAAQFYQARPWRLVYDDEPVTIASPFPGEPPMAVCVMGGAGVARGVVIFDSEQNRQDFLREGVAPDAVFVVFEKLSRVPPTVRREAEEHGWTTVNKSSFPAIIRIREGGPVAHRGDDVRRATAAFRVLAEVAALYRESRRAKTKGSAEPRASQQEEVP
jgi:hypothetical protein